LFACVFKPHEPRDGRTVAPRPKIVVGHYQKLSFRTPGIDAVIPRLTVIHREKPQKKNSTRVAAESEENHAFYPDSKNFSSIPIINSLEKQVSIPQNLYN